MSGKTAAQKKKANTNKLQELKDTCPAHRHKDLDILYKQEKGNTQKIIGVIQSWWDEPQPVPEAQWEDVSKKPKKIVPRYSGRGGGGRGNIRSGDRGGRGGYGRGMSGGRGGGPDRDRRTRDRDSGRGSQRVEGREGRGGPRNGGDRKTSSYAGSSTTAPETEETFPGPSLVKATPTARPLQGAWGQRAAAAATPTPESAPAAPPSPAPAAPELPVAVQEELVPVAVEEIVVEETLAVTGTEETIDVGIVTSHDPTPSGLTMSEKEEPPPAPAPTGGNVWATKGSAHLIQAEKKPVMVESSSSVADDVNPVNEIAISLDDPLLPESITDQFISPPTAPSDAIDAGLPVGLPASVNGANINAAGWNPTPATNTQEIMQPSPVGPVSVTSSQPVVETINLDSVHINPPSILVVEEVIVPTEVPVIASTPVVVESQLKSTSVLNMGHWETGEGEESVSHDFGFGSFGQENDGASVDEITINSTTNNVTVSVQQQAESVNVATSTVSPARPPPGLPPMPEKIVHVHELENNFEKASLSAKQEEESKNVDTLSEGVTSSVQHPVPTGVPPAVTDGFAHMPPQPAAPQQTYGAAQYAMNMYNYNGQSGVGAPNGFMGVPAATPILSGGVPPQPKQPNLGQQNGSLPQPQGNIYGAPAPTNQSNENNANSDTNNTPANPTNGAMPPGMVPQYNPALFYGQQPYQMGQPHGVGAYGYGFPTQYGGVQAGYAFQQVMGQGAGYAQPYEEQPQHHNGNNPQGGYNQKSGGGYRGGGRNNHQYQNQYTPQGHSGYGQQTYNMGYNDHFNQRGGYPAGNMDPYMQSSGGYHQDNDHQIGKGKPKGNNRNNFGNNQSMHHQYQQGGHQGGNQFGGGLQGANASESTSGNNSGLPSYQGWGGGL